MQKRTYRELQALILKSIGKEPKSVSRIAREISADWRTVHRQLTWLEKLDAKVSEIKRDNVSFYKVKCHA
jgi:predicted transcriptional regulator